MRTFKGKIVNLRWNKKLDVVEHIGWGNKETTFQFSLSTLWMLES
jgi:hypothetical protein